MPPHVMRVSSIFMFIVVIFVLLSALVPPFQSPDEPAHIVRAYLFSKGQILLKKPDPLSLSGGNVDSALLDYVVPYAKLITSPTTRLSRSDVLAVSGIRWSGNPVFFAAPGTGYYFPLVYAPQAAGLAMGELFHLTINASYRLARLITLVTSLAILLVAFRAFPANPLIISLLLLPMSLFQFVSASLDAVTTALAVLCASLFMRGATREKHFSNAMGFTLGGCILLLVTTRMHLVFLPFLLLIIYYIRKNKYFIWQFVVISAFSLIWLLITVKASHVNRAAPGFSTVQVMLYYLQNPKTLLDIFTNTATDTGTMLFYGKSLVGILGWLDTYFSNTFYQRTGTILLILAFLSVGLRTLKQEWIARVGLLVVSISATVVVFLLLLVTWTPMGSKLIEGVQGRYFITPLIFLGYALAGSEGFHTGTHKTAARLLLGILVFMTVTTMPEVLIKRYFMVPFAAGETEKTRYEIKPSIPLDKQNPIPLWMRTDKKTALKKIAIQFGTYQHKHEGQAEIRLAGSGGVVKKITFNLAELADNQYHFFPLDSKEYESGEIIALSGSGISTWASYNTSGPMLTCILYEYVSGERYLTPGCPEVPE